MRKLVKHSSVVKPDDSSLSIVSSRLNALGIKQSKKPFDNMPEVPLSFGDLSDQALMDLFNELTVWANYLNFELAKAEVEEDDLAAKLKIERAKFLVTNKPEKGTTVTEVKAEAELNDDVIEVERDLRIAKAFRSLLEASMQNAERTIALVSRELSRRIGLAPAAGRLGWMKP